MHLGSLFKEGKVGGSLLPGLVGQKSSSGNGNGNCSGGVRERERAAGLGLTGG